MVNRRHVIVAIAAISTLAACGSPSADVHNAEEAALANQANSEEAAPVINTAAPAPAVAAAGGAVTADYMVGKWSAMGEDCKDTLEFRKDGTVATPFGNAKWALNGDKLALDFGEGSKVDPSTIKALGPNRIEITKVSGEKETQKRC